MKKTILSLLAFILICFSLTGCGEKTEEENKKDIEPNKNEVQEISDSMKFKEEYEKINGEKNSSGKEHRTLSIPENNPFVYTTAEEIVEKIENKETFYVYFGSSYCPWCRSVMEKFIEVAKKNNIDKVYYVDIWDGDHIEILRDTYELNDDGKPELVKEGGKGYKELLKYFDNVLSDYNLTDEAGKKVSVGEKRIFAPNFIYVKDGKAKKLIEGISEKQKDAREELTDKILEDEEKQFNDFFKE